MQKLHDCEVKWWWLYHIFRKDSKQECDGGRGTKLPQSDAK